MLLAATILAAAAPAPAAAAPYVAQPVSQAPFPTFEQGDTAQLFFEFKNVGDNTWYRDGFSPVRLGGANPFDRASGFYNPPDWIAANRPTGLDQAIVAPGATGRFTFVALAPAPTGVFREYFAPLAEGVGWMTPTDGQYLDLTVLPAQPPVVTITSAPSRVSTGQAIHVIADVTDNRAVAGVTFEVGGQVVAVTTPTSGRTYEADLSTSALGAGTQTVIVRGTDLGGRQSFAAASFEVESNAPPVVTPPVSDADRDGVLRPLDCDDSDPAIHPGVTDVPGDGVDQDCANGDAVFAELTATTTFLYRYTRTTLVKRIDITRLKGGETVTIACSGRRCPFAARKFAIRKAGTRSFGRSLLRGRRLPAGARVTVRVEKPQTIGTYTSLTVRRNLAPKIARKCLRPGSKAPSRCE